MKHLLPFVLLAFVGCNQSLVPDKVFNFPNGTPIPTPMLDGVTGASARSFTLQLGQKFKSLTIEVDFTRDAGTITTIAHECSLNGTTFPEPHSRQETATIGTFELAPIIDLNTIQASYDMAIEVDVQKCHAYRFTVTETSGGASDLFDVTVVGLLK